MMYASITMYVMSLEFQKQPIILDLTVLSSMQSTTNQFALHV